MVRDSALALRGRGYQCEVFTTNGLGHLAESLQGVGIPVWDCSERRPRIAGLPLRLVRKVAGFKPDIVHAHSGTWLPATMVKMLLRYPHVVFTDHGRYPPEPRYRALIERWWFYRRTDRLVAVSSALARYLKDFLRLPSQPEVIQNGIDLTAYRDARRRRSELRGEWGLADDEVLAISVGRLEAVKNHAGMLQALAQVAADVPKLRLAMLGVGRLRKQLLALSEQLGLQDRVMFLGYRTDVADCLGAADLFVNASTTEGFPLSLLEALAAGLPVMATSVGGIPEALGSPPAGILIPPGDTRRLAEAFAELTR